MVRQGRGLTRHCSRTRIRAHAARIRRRAYPALVHVRRHRYSQSRKRDEGKSGARPKIAAAPRGRVTVEFRTGSTPISRGGVEGGGPHRLLANAPSNCPPPPLPRKWNARTGGLLFLLTGDPFRVTSDMQ